MYVTGSRYIQIHFYCLAVGAGFYSDVVECFSVDPATWVRFPAVAGKIFSLFDKCHRGELYEYFALRINHLFSFSVTVSSFDIYLIMPSVGKLVLPVLHCFLMGYLETELFYFIVQLVSKDAKIRNRYNQVPHLTQGTNSRFS